jgi:hypothetical protein
MNKKILYKLAEAIADSSFPDGTYEYEVGRLLFRVTLDVDVIVIDPGSYYTPPEYQAAISVREVECYIGGHLVELDYYVAEALEYILVKDYGCTYLTDEL